VNKTSFLSDHGTVPWQPGRFLLTVCSSSAGIVLRR